MLLHISIVLALVLLVPMICHKIHIPTIVGFILMGMLFGPHLLGVLQHSDTIDLLGKMGMMYIMFQSGSEIDLNQVKTQKYKVLVFGLLTFLFPALIGYAVGFYALSMPLLASLLLGAMFGSHTLMTYPIVSRYGLQKQRAVSIVVGGTVLAVTLSLMVLAVVKQQVMSEPLWHTLLVLPLVFVVILLLLPRVAQVFLKRFTDPITDFVFVMLVLVVSALLTDYAGLDAVLGAFLSGLAMNRLLPNRSGLVKRITFVGNTIFVPLFLISIGMLIDVRLFYESWSILILALTLIAVKLCGKWLAAAVVAWLWRFHSNERQLMYGLTHAASAGTLAIVSIGYSMSLFGSALLNAAVLMILVLCTISSFVTEYAAKQLALQEDARMDADKDEERWRLCSMSRYDYSLHSLAVSAQLNHTQLSVGDTWQSIRQMVEQESCSVVVYEERQPLNTISRLLVAVPKYAEKERDFITCFGLVRRLAGEIGAKVVFYANADTQNALQRMCRREGKELPAAFREMDEWNNINIVADDMRDNDMLVLLSSRCSTASYNPLFEQIPELLSGSFNAYSYLVLYPEQQTGGVDADDFLNDIPQASGTWSVVSRIKRRLLSFFGNFFHQKKH